MTVSATEAATIEAITDVTGSASGGSTFTGQGTARAAGGAIATNRILSGAAALVDHATLDLTGDLAVTAANDSTISAQTLSALSTGSEAVGLVLAFNTIGWKPSNVLFAAVDAILGDPLISTAFGGSQPSATSAVDHRLDRARGGRPRRRGLDGADRGHRLQRRHLRARRDHGRRRHGGRDHHRLEHGQRHGRGDDRPHAGDGDRGRDRHRRRRRRDRVRHLAGGRGGARERPRRGHPEPLRRPDPQRVPVHDALGHAPGRLRRPRPRRRRRRPPVHGHRRDARPRRAGLHRLRALEDADRAQPAQRRRHLRRAERPRHRPRPRRARLGRRLLRADRPQRRAQRGHGLDRRLADHRRGQRAGRPPPSRRRSPPRTPASSPPGRATAPSS